jgi:hypothetical protein
MSEAYIAMAIRDLGADISPHVGSVHCTSLPFLSPVLARLSQDALDTFAPIEHPNFQTKKLHYLNGAVYIGKGED